MVALAFSVGRLLSPLQRAAPVARPIGLRLITSQFRGLMPPRGSTEGHERATFAKDAHQVGSLRVVIVVGCPVFVQRKALKRNIYIFIEKLKIDA